MLIGEGLSNRAVAERLTLSVRTVEGHIYQAMEKTGTTSRDELAALLHRPQARDPSEYLVPDCLRSTSAMTSVLATRLGTTTTDAPKSDDLSGRACAAHAWRATPIRQWDATLPVSAANTSGAAAEPASASRASP